MLSTDKDNCDVIIIGITNDAYDYIKDGKTHTFDLTKLGKKFKIILYGGPTNKNCLETIQSGAKAQGIVIDDQRGKDFKI